ncbi:MAG: glycosyltransferase family 9 protein [Ktedonobacteraceae bacterium]|nr:glycosyltransferase family 9 protein [Ktedonobacteraceae bacterium]
MLIKIPQTEQITLPLDARILVVKLASIGDLLLATPALRALHETYPLGRIDLLVTPESADLLQGWDAIHKIIVLDKYLFDSLSQVVKHPRRLLRLLEFNNLLRAGEYDAVLLLHHLTLPFGRLKHQFLALASGARWRVGLDNGYGWFLNVRVRDEGFGARHEAEYYMAVAEAAGAKVRDRNLYVPLDEEERAQARRLVYGDSGTGSVQHPIIALHAGSGSYSTARRWPVERFARLADMLYREFGGQLLLVGGPEEIELHRQLIDKMRTTMPVRSLAGRSSIRVTAAVMELVDLFIGNDAGPMHLAAAAGTPVVAIFGPSNYRAWGPYTGSITEKRAEVVHLDLSCMPCFYRGHDLGTPEGCATRDCLTMLGVGSVLKAARRLLKERRRREQATTKEEVSQQPAGQAG